VFALNGISSSSNSSSSLAALQELQLAVGFCSWCCEDLCCWWFVKARKQKLIDCGEGPNSQQQLSGQDKCWQVLDVEGLKAGHEEVNGCSYSYVVVVVTHVTIDGGGSELIMMKGVLQLTGASGNGRYVFHVVPGSMLFDAVIGDLHQSVTATGREKSY
jgi:hypothetical protein